MSSSKGSLLKGAGKPLREEWLGALPDCSYKGKGILRAKLFLGESSYADVGCSVSRPCSCLERRAKRCDVVLPAAFGDPLPFGLSTNLIYSNINHGYAV